MPRRLFAMATLVIASPASAEVADKVPSAGALWAWALGFSAIAFLLEMVRPRFGFVMVPVAALSAWAGHIELSDPHVGPAILNEIGSSYVSMSYFSFAVGLLGPLIAVLLCEVVRRRKA
jgi:hypothetical protein